MKLYKSQVEIEKFVKHKSKTWIDSGLVDHKGRHSLISWTDTSKGILADPKSIRECNLDEINAIKFFIEKTTIDIKGGIILKT